MEKSGSRGAAQNPSELQKIESYHYIMHKCIAVQESEGRGNWKEEKE